MTDDAFHNVKPPILTKSEKQANSAGKGDTPRKYDRIAEDKYRSNKFWDNYKKEEQVNTSTYSKGDIVVDSSGVKSICVGDDLENIGYTSWQIIYNGEEQ